MRYLFQILNDVITMKVGGFLNWVKENDVSSDAEIIISEIKYDTENNEMSPFQKDIYDVILYDVDTNDPEPDEEKVILYV